MLGYRPRQKARGSYVSLQDNSGLPTKFYPATCLPSRDYYSGLPCRSPAERCGQKPSGMFKEDPDIPRHCYRAECKAVDYWARAALGDTFEYRRKRWSDKKQSWLGGEIYDTALIHAPDNRRIADDPIKMSDSTEKQFIRLDDVEIDNAKPILAIHSRQIDKAERIAGNVCINRAQALFEDSRVPVQKPQKQLSTDNRRIV